MAAPEIKNFDSPAETRPFEGKGEAWPAAKSEPPSRQAARRHLTKEARNGADSGEH